MELQILGPRLRAARKQQGIKQTAIASEVHVNPAYISMIENGKVKTVSAHLLRKLCALLEELESNEPKPDNVVPIAPVKNAEQYHPAPECEDIVN